MKKSLCFCIIFITCISSAFGTKPTTKKLPETLRLEELAKNSEVIVIAQFSGETFGKKMFRGHDLVWRMREFSPVEILKGTLDKRFIFAEAQVKKTLVKHEYKVNYEEGDRVLLFLHKEEDFTCRTMDEKEITKRKFSVIDNRSIIRVTESDEARELYRVNRLFHLSLKSFAELQKEIKRFIRIEKKS